LDTSHKPLSVEVQISIIRTHMPETYKSIQAQAQAIGTKAYALVRQGLRGEPDCFYAVEGGHVVGTPFNQSVTADIARHIVQFGCTYMCLWPTTGSASNANQSPS
jgi:hypothetical protein